MTELGRIRRIWTRWAGIYDLRVRLFLRWRGAAVDALRPCRGDTILDLACGTGLNFPYIIGRIGPEGSIIRVDYTRAMLDRENESLLAIAGIAWHLWRRMPHGCLSLTSPAMQFSAPTLW